MSLDETCDKTRSSPTRFSSMLWPTVELARYWSPKKMRCAHGCGHRVSWGGEKSCQAITRWFTAMALEFDSWLRSPRFCRPPILHMMTPFRYQCIPMRCVSDLLFLNQYPPLFFGSWINHISLQHGLEAVKAPLCFRFAVRIPSSSHRPGFGVCFHGNCEAKNRRKSGAIWAPAKTQVKSYIDGFSNKNSFGNRKPSCRFFLITWQPMVLGCVTQWSRTVDRGQKWLEYSFLQGLHMSSFSCIEHSFCWRWFYGVPESFRIWIDTDLDFLSEFFQNDLWTRSLYIVPFLLISPW